MRYIEIIKQEGIRIVPAPGVLIFHPAVKDRDLCPQIEEEEREMCGVLFRTPPESLADQLTL